jgi:hypothetical protein
MTKHETTHIDNTCDVILQHPLQRFVIPGRGESASSNRVMRHSLWINTFQVAYIDRSAKNLLVERSVEIRVKQSSTKH